MAGFQIQVDQLRAFLTGRVAIKDRIPRLTLGALQLLERPEGRSECGGRRAPDIVHAGFRPFRANLRLPETHRVG